MLQKRALRFICFTDRCDHAIPLLLGAKILTIHFLYQKLLAETMHDVNIDVIPSQLKDLFIPTAKFFHIISDLQFPATSILKNLEIERKSFSRIGAKLWNGILTKLRTLPRLIFKRKIRMILLNILESEDSCEDLESIISIVRKYSQQLSRLSYPPLTTYYVANLSTSHNTLSCQLKLVIQLFLQT